MEEVKLNIFSDYPRDYQSIYKISKQSINSSFITVFFISYTELEQA